MLNLFKYELKKSLGMKIVMLCITAVLEIFFLIGLYGENERIFGTTTFILFVLALVSTIIIGLHSMRMLANDLNTKQAYMLFMTPNNSFKILGAKVLENGVSIILIGAFFTVLGIFDITLMISKYDSLSAALDYAKIFLEFYDLAVVNIGMVVAVIAELIAHWLYVISVGFFAIVLCATFFNGRKWNVLISFGIFLGILIGINNILGLILIPITPTLGNIGVGFFYIHNPSCYHIHNKRKHKVDCSLNIEETNTNIS